MPSARSLIYTVVGMIFFVILPFFLIASAHLTKHLPGTDCTVTNISGVACVRYEVEHTLDQKTKTGITYRKTSAWIPLQPGSEIGFGALIKTAKKSFVDIMINKTAALRIDARSLVKLDQPNQKPQTIALALHQGRVLSRVIAPKSSNLQTKTSPGSRHHLCGGLSPI